jgi:hypothetical protein
MTAWHPNWFNNCNRTVPAALRYLAEHDRPSGGQDNFNSEHLYQLAEEIERVYNKSLSCPYGGLIDEVSLSADSLKDLVRVSYRYKECSAQLVKEEETIYRLLLEIRKIRNSLYPPDPNIML